MSRSAFWLTALLTLGVSTTSCNAFQAPQDTTPPSVSLKSSSASVTEKGDLLLTATSEDKDIARVVFYDKGKKVAEVNKAPYQATIAATAALNGDHIYSAQAYDTSGNASVSAPVQVSVNIADTSIGELLNNGTFASGKDGWWTSGSPGWDVNAGESCLTIGTPGANPWDVILGQGGVGLNQDATYTLSFTARADVATGFKPLLQFDAAPYTSYFATEVNDLGPVAKNYTYTFQMKEKSDAKAAFQFQMGGKAATKVCVSNVSLKGPKFGSGGTTVVADDRRIVRVNQVGYLPDAPKTATIAHDSATPLAWTLSKAGKTVAQGKTRVFGQDAASGEHVHQADFSGVTATGEGYVLDVAGLQSHPFKIGKDIYGKLQYDALAYFYHNRSGIAIEQKYVGDAKWARPAGHLGLAPNQGDTSVSCFDGTDTRGNTWEGCDYHLDASKGWYDAGDHGKYVVNAGVSVWTLLNQYERASRTSTASRFADGKLQIPENTNSKNDLLDEVRWEMDFLLGMQVPAGKTLKLPIGDQSGNLGALTRTAVDASGMVHHKLHDVAWTGLPTRPDQDPQKRYLYYPTTAATLNLAANAAQCARVFKGVDDAYAAKCLTAAEKAWDAAQRNPDVYAYDIFTGGGPYNDSNVSDEFYWAAAELYATTGAAKYLTFLKASPLYLQADKDLTWGELTQAATLTLATVKTELPAADVKTAQSNLIAAANSYLKEVDQLGYRLPFKADPYPWGSNSAVVNRALVLGTAYDLSKNRKYLEGALEGMNYLLGRNPMDKSYVSGYGSRPLRNPHHRFWAHQADPNSPEVPAGALSGGPNSESFSDPVAANMKGKCVGLTCYIDDLGAWTMNEITINWNAPLSWVAAFLDSTAE
ncbi:glycoside hydrolase family 9 protein [Deinococcus roseus]|uniref:Endoglucanase n=1 Tax=Deinococcus roseus TaxID=392414 RepID=A0ABQ2CV11_9DEIO|nr:glycoside hydrolase family 9 protein [Deinococcus roseus]GGJ20097.1 hypothetical protein GCM10008938_02810 [Deinococcus roseus]